MGCVAQDGQTDILRVTLLPEDLHPLLGVALGSGSALVAVAPHLLQVGARFPWLSVLGTIGAVFPIGMLASLAAVRRTLRAPLLPALKAER